MHGIIYWAYNPLILNIQTSKGASKYGVLLFFFREIEGPHGAKGLLFLVGVFFAVKTTVRTMVCN